MRRVGKRKDREITMHASGELLKEGALFNDELHKIQSAFRFPKGVFHYKTHEEANKHMQEFEIEAIVQVQKERQKKEEK